MVAIFVIVVATALFAHLTVGIPALLRRGGHFFAGPGGRRRPRSGGNPP